MLLASLLAGCMQESRVTQLAPLRLSAGKHVPSRPRRFCQEPARPPQTPAGRRPRPKASEESVKVGSCDGENTVEVSKSTDRPGLGRPLMDQWKRNHPEANWVAEQKEQHAHKTAGRQRRPAQGRPSARATPTAISPSATSSTWTRETEKFVAEGSRIFHNADALGSTVAVSCDMCHPNAANTHPETYPKFQTQLGRVALLRDMINWCIENPVRGSKLDPDGPKMRALEAYIQSQRKGMPMNYGKH